MPVYIHGAGEVNGIGAEVHSYQYRSKRQ